MSHPLSGLTGLLFPEDPWLQIPATRKAEGESSQAKEHRSRLQVRADGKVAFHPHLRAPESSTTGETAPARPVDQPRAPTRSQHATEPPQSFRPQVPESEERELTTLTGNLGRAPWTRQDGEESVREFLLAHNHTPGESATWYKVTARGEVAKQVEDGVRHNYIRKGKPVTVTGYVGEPNNKREKTLPFEATLVTRSSSNRQ